MTSMKDHAKPDEYSSLEMMAICGARTIRDGETVFAGTGLPVLAAMLAQKTHAPRSKIVYEGGFIDSRNIHLPLSVADSRLTYRAAAAIGLIETLGVLLQGGRIHVGFLGAAQIDQYGNVNTTMIGSFDRPKIRLPGSGGGNDIASSSKRVVIIMTHDKRKFVERLDYMTSPGYLEGPGGRERVGLRGGGPSRVVTNLCVLTFEEKTLRMKLHSVHPGITVQKVLENTGFELLLPEKVLETEPPTYEELKTVREIDSTGIYLEKEVRKG